MLDLEIDDIVPANLNPANFDAGYLGVHLDGDDIGLDDADATAESLEAEIEREAGGLQPIVYRPAPLPRLVDVKLPKAKLTKDADAFLKANAEPEPKAANDNYRAPKESWNLRDSITKGNIGDDASERLLFLTTARYLRYLLDEAERDAIGLAVHTPGKDTPVDHGLQRTAEGMYAFDNGDSLDRKPILVETRSGADKRHRGPVRRASKSGPVSNSGFDSTRDMPFAVRHINTRQELDEVIAVVGPLWVHLEQAVSNNASATDVGQALGYNGSRAPGVGTAILKIALQAAAEALERCESQASYENWLLAQPDCLAIPARRLKLAYRTQQAA